MNTEREIIYREEQRFGLWVRWVVVLSMALAVPLSVFSLIKIPSEQETSGILEILTVIILGILLPIGAVLLFVTLKLETEVRADGLYVRFFPLHFHFRRFGAEDLSECHARTYSPIREYGGWGIRRGLGGRGRAYNVSGNKGVQLVFKSGKRLLIGSQRAEELEDAIRSIMGSD